MKKLNKIFVFALAIAMFLPFSTLAATMKAGQEVHVQKGENVKDNLYIAAGNVSVGSDVFGDLLAVGGNVLLSKDVSQDISAAGGSVTILGGSGGDVRAAGGNILIAGKMAGDLLAAGGTVVVSSDVTVGKDAVIAGGQITLDGDVSGNVSITGGVATINGHVKGNVKTRTDGKLTLGSGAVIDGNLEYSARSQDSLVVNEGALVKGETSFSEIAIPQKSDVKKFIPAIIGTFILFKILALLVSALILVFLFRRFSNTLLENTMKKPLEVLGKGFIALVVIPAASILLFVTLIGMPLGIILLLSYAILVTISCIYAGVLFGAWLSMVLRKSHQLSITWKSVVGGVLLLAVVRFVPVIGWLVAFFVFLLVLGSLSDMVYKKVFRKD